MPRGSPNKVPKMRHPIIWNNVPVLEKIVVASHVKEGMSNSGYTHAAGMALQAITGQRAEVRRAKTTQNQFQRKNAWMQKKGKPVAVVAEIKGEPMWHFLSTLIHIMLPKLKDWRGLRGKNGDSNGNMKIHLDSEIVGGWPELAINYNA